MYTFLKTTVLQSTVKVENAAKIVLCYILNSSRILQRVVLYKNIYLARKVQDARVLKYEENIQIIRKLIISPFTVGMIGILGAVKNNDENKTQIMKELLIKADMLFDQADYRGTYDLLSKYKDDKEVEILWRLSRVIYKLSEMTSGAEARKLTYEGYDYLRTALDIQEDHYVVHKWMAGFLNSKSSLEGTKAQIRESYNIKKHVLRAIELNPTGDAMLFYILGTWCYEISNLAWYQRKIASVLFGEPPTSSFEEALMYYENAEKIDPNFYSHNLLMLGKTYLKLNRKEDAIKCLKKAAEYPVKDYQDQKTKQEAQKILNNI